MKQVGGVWLPDGEVHLVEWMTKKNQIVDGKLTYQLDKQHAAMAWVKAWRTAVDVGAHCGLWSMRLQKRFELLVAFEPVAAHRDCWELNTSNPYADDVPGREQRVMHACALGERDGMVKIHTAPTSSGDSWVDGDGDIPMRRLDDFDLQDVDFLKLDCEGYELFALRGGEEMLKRCHPCVIVEQKPGRAQKFGLQETEAVDYLRGLGAHLRTAISGDFILSWD